MKFYATIYIRSNEHPRTINTPMMGRTYYTAIRVYSREEMLEKVEELKKAGENILEISRPLGTKIYL